VGEGGGFFNNPQCRNSSLVGHPLGRIPILVGHPLGRNSILVGHFQKKDSPVLSLPPNVSEVFLLLSAAWRAQGGWVGEGGGLFQESPGPFSRGVYKDPPETLIRQWFCAGFIRIRRDLNQAVGRGLCQKAAFCTCSHCSTRVPGCFRVLSGGFRWRRISGGCNHPRSGARGLGAVPLGTLGSASAGVRPRENSYL